MVRKRRWTQRVRMVLAHAGAARLSGVGAEPRGPRAHRQRGLRVRRADLHARRRRRRRRGCRRDRLGDGGLRRLRHRPGRPRTATRPRVLAQRRRGWPRSRSRSACCATPGRAGMATTLTAVATDGDGSRSPTWATRAATCSATATLTRITQRPHLGPAAGRRGLAGGGGRALPPLAQRGARSVNGNLVGAGRRRGAGARCPATACCSPATA